MSLVIVGSVAYDSIETPFGTRERILGGSATHAALAASFFTDVRVVAVVGEDFGEEQLAVFHTRGVNTDDVERVAGAKTFFWRGNYDFDLNVAHTLDTQLNVFADFKPKLSSPSLACTNLFLGNIAPELQLEVRKQYTLSDYIALDSMNFWIESSKDALIRALQTVDVVLLNDAEVRLLTGEPNLVRAARKVRDWGASGLVVKHGEYGAALYSEAGVFALPGYPLETVIDPTGAGDSFAGGFLGYLAAHTEQALTDEVYRRAMAYGSVMASFNVEEFGCERVQRLTLSEISERFDDFRKLTLLDEYPLEWLLAR